MKYLNFDDVREMTPDWSDIAIDAFVDKTDSICDERELGGNIIVTLLKGYAFDWADDPPQHEKQFKDIDQAIAETIGSVNCYCFGCTH